RPACRAASRRVESADGPTPERLRSRALTPRLIRPGVIPMTKSAFLAAEAVLASALATPAMAQQVIYNPGYCAQFYPNANCQNLGPGNPYTGGYQQQTYGAQVYRNQAYQ